MDQTEASALIEEIVELTREQGGAKNPEALSRVKAHLSSLRRSLPPSTIVSEKIASATGWAEIIFSERQHREYGGYEHVRTFLLQDCWALQHVIQTRLPGKTGEP
jgi:hypothetical protein